MATTPPLATGANPPIPAEQLAALTSLLSGLTAAASGTATPATSSGTTRTAFPKHARLDGAKTFANWTRQLRLCCQEHSLHCHQYSKEVSQVCGRSRHQLPVCSLQALSARWCSP
ncbi:BZ3501_MvSof-1269-A2-R1_Chr12-1g03393 [Microbotryum saponariae]|nr:BZ3501_MvSof-1269-A2-R1_Chr12-1g03393 [Microbotryum saponariae]